MFYERRVKKNLEQILVNNVMNCLPDFKKSFKHEIQRLDMDDSFTEKEMEVVFSELYQKLLAEIERNFFRFMQNAPPAVSTRYDLLLINPDACGYPLSESESLSVGALYCLGYYAFTGKKADSVVASKLNHILHHYIDEVLHELDGEI